MKSAIGVVLAVALGGCASMPAPDRAVVGNYERGGFNETTFLEIKADHTYRISQFFIFCVIGPDGILHTAQDEERGTWELQEGVVVLKTAAPKPREYYQWFARLRPDRLDGKKGFVSDVTGAPLYGRWCFAKRRGKPDWLMEPDSPGGGGSS